MNELKMFLGDKVEFNGADSRFAGIVVSVFHKYDEKLELFCGPARVIVQDERGLLLIKNPETGIVIKKGIE